ncbi:helix-turn-helix domain-containing protein [Amycolatopsis sp. FDAARGOS 1241]|nr:helix-turn-helix domain-containing protein [Amycolatopsis sp. FDAARGOS 1241]
MVTVRPAVAEETPAGVPPAPAHDELIAKGPEDTTVTAVALQWGFSNAHRFTALHREHYGTSPGQALAGPQDAGARRSPATISSAARSSAAVGSNVDDAFVYARFSSRTSIV